MTDGNDEQAEIRTPDQRLRVFEQDLVTRVAQAIDPQTFEEAFAAGSELSHREAVALVRG